MRHWTIISLELFGLLVGSTARAQGVDVSTRIVLQPPTTRHNAPDLSGVVLWLTPLTPSAQPVSAQPTGVFRLLQKGKQFLPHLLVIPTGSSVKFPNHDPFFHNVFSLFNGKRFDLGLYEPGTSRSVRFDRDGVSYIFCNIHPEMGAVVISLSTPFYAVSNAVGDITLHDIPPGSYLLHLWSETAIPTDPTALQTVVHVGTTAIRQSDIALKPAVNFTPHKNKFGEDYPPAHDSHY